MNIQKMMQQAQAMQTKIAEAQEKANDIEVEGEAGAGLVKVTVTGGGEAKKLNIKPEAIDEDDLEGSLEMLEDLIIAAFNNAKKKAEEEVQAKMSEATSGLGLPPGMKMPF